VARLAAHHPGGCQGAHRQPARDGERHSRVPASQPILAFKSMV
jgi:hypothetical protein